MNTISNNEPSSNIKFLKGHIDNAAEQLASMDDHKSGTMGSLIYLGTHHDSVPRDLILDPILESGEIHTWMLMKIHLQNPALPSVLPTQSDLSQQLKCSRTVLGRHMQTLRALRWITLCASVRGHDGTMRGNLYAQHDSPLSLQETLYLDPSYIQFLESRSRADVYRRLNVIKASVLEHVDYSIIMKNEQLDELPSKLELISNKVVSTTSTKTEDTHLACPPEAVKPQELGNMYTKITTAFVGDDSISNETKEPSEGSDMRRVISGNSDISSLESHAKNITKAIYTVSSSNINTTTVLNEKNEELLLPKKIRDSERLEIYALKAVTSLPPGQRQFALDYLGDRIKAGEAGSVKVLDNPIRYLHWIVKNINDNTMPDSNFGVREKVSESLGPKIENETPDQKQKAWEQQMSRLGVEVGVQHTE